MNQTVGQTVEELITIKDRLSNYLDGSQVEAINNACNILDHKFSRFSTVDAILNPVEKQITKEKILIAMDDMLQRDYCCDYIFVQNNKEICYKSILSSEAYVKAIELSTNGDVECYMAPLGRKAASPVFTVIDGTITLSGQVLNP